MKLHLLHPTPLSPSYLPLPMGEAKNTTTDSLWRMWIRTVTGFDSRHTNINMEGGWREWEVGYVPVSASYFPFNQNLKNKEKVWFRGRRVWAKAETLSVDMNNGAELHSCKHPKKMDGERKRRRRRRGKTVCFFFFIHGVKWILWFLHEVAYVYSCRAPANAQAH